VTPSLDSLSTQATLALMVANIFLNQLGVPVPAVPTLLLAGAVAAGHPGWGVEMLVGATVACAVTDLLWYVAGRRYGNSVMKFLCMISLTPDSCVSDTQARFDRWGPKAVLVAKFVPGLALVAPPLAGAMRMGWPTFLGLTSLAGCAWAGLYLGIGALLRPQVNWLLPRLSEVGATAAGLIGVLLVGYVGVKWWERRRFLATLRMLRISVGELYELMAARRAPVVIDVRPHGARKLQPARIPGALLVALDEVEEKLGELPRDRDIVVYCSCPNEASAARVARILMNHGFTRVRPLHGGLDAWIDAGYRIEALPAAEPGNGEYAPVPAATTPDARSGARESH
jgi:membrane protein DedA with SNARE-associated domain/rhodanese-related sulfurtransferase